MRYSFALLTLAAGLWGAAPDLEQARKLYNLTEFDHSLQVLQAVPAKDAAVYALMGRNYYMLGDHKRATDTLERAVAADPSNAEYCLWLARAYGRRAETSSPFTAPGQASKARQYFEKSVALDPHNVEALSDLFEYYLEAPGFLGGGMDKAQSMVPRIAAISLAEGHWAESRIAEKRKEYGDAEAQLRRAIDAAPQKIGKLIDLARFLARQGRIQEADQSLSRAEAIAPGTPRLMYARADLYIHTGRNREQARQLLQRYLACKLTPDDPPRADALKLLKQVQGS
ncbi:MAG TPA: tetratricopeptide repeat protein [Bryobacteraceae bacterium]|nr:tetratricopeptide repeat protein [Bryobacteraceae bacterium]